MKKILIFLFLILTTYYMIHTTVFAQSANTGLNLTVSPSLIEITANPGDTVSQKFRVRNNAPDAVPLSIHIDGLAPDGTNGQVIPVKAQPSDPSLSWISFQTATITAAPKEWTDVAFTVHVPKEAAFGYYYAIRIGQTTTTTKDKNGTSLLGEVIIPLLLTVQSPNAKAEATVLNFSTSAFVNEYLPITFLAKIQSKGNVHLRPHGNIFIRTGISDKDTDIIEVNQTGGVVLPGATRVFSTQWSDGFLVQKPTGLAINWDKLTHFRIGKYTATLLMVYDNGVRDVPLQATTTFWVFPYTLFAEILVVLAVVLLVGRFLLKWYIAKEVRKYH